MSKCGLTYFNSDNKLKIKIVVSSMLHEKVVKYYCNETVWGPRNIKSTQLPLSLAIFTGVDPLYV